jgi:hypothetical protein
MEGEKLLPETGDSAAIHETAPKKKNSRKRSIIIFIVVSLINVGLSDLTNLP